jgi:hypothetical protein
MGISRFVFILIFKVDFIHTCSSIKEFDASKGTFSLDIILELIAASKTVQKWDLSDSELEDKGKKEFSGLI